MSVRRAVSGEELGRLGIIHWEVVVNSRTPAGACVSFVKASKLNFFFFPPTPLDPKEMEIRAWRRATKP